MKKLEHEDPVDKFSLMLKTTHKIQEILFEGQNPTQTSHTLSSWTLISRSSRSDM